MSGTCYNNGMRFISQVCGKNRPESSTRRTDRDLDVEQITIWII